MMRLCVVALSIALLAGCVSTKTIPLKGEAIGAMGGGTIVASTREKPAFSATTAGKMMFGLIGAAAAVSAGNEIVRANNVDDPAVYIGDRLLADLADAHRLSVRQKNGAVADTNEPARLAKLYSDADLVLDVQTVNWSLAYFPTDWNSYRVIYSVKLRLLDTKKGRMVAEGFCARVPDKTDSAPSYEQLMVDNATRLKQELVIAADYCIGELRSKVLSLQPVAGAPPVAGRD